jgi:hypothetical protein
MDLYFYTKRKDVAATSLADLASYIAALAAPTTAANLATIARVTAKIESFVQSDTGEPLNLYFSPDGTTYEAWSTDGTTTLAVGLGLQDPRMAYTYASTTSFTIAGNARVGTLALNTTALRDALEQNYHCGRGQTSGQFYLHGRKTSAAGVTETIFLLPVYVQAGVLGHEPEELMETTYLLAAAFQASAVIHLGSVTSLTGGGASTLDGITAGGTDHPVGCLRITSEGSVGRTWKLIGTYIAATDLDLGRVKPTNSDATLNPCHWQVI